MLINEVLDNPHQLKSGTEQTEFITREMRKQGLGVHGLMVYEAVEDPTQIFILVTVNGAWEVHHLLSKNGDYAGGSLLPSGQGRSGPNPRYLSTAIKLYEGRLNKGHHIRVVGTSAMWSTYRRVIDRMLKQTEGRYIADEVDESYCGIDGDTYIAQVLRPKGKFYEMFKEIKLPV